jgi:hypothetical protein
MKKSICTIVILITGIAYTYSQSLTPTVIASAGSYYESTNLKLSYTLGEIAVTTLSTTNLILTQGFQQPTLIISSVNDPDEFDWSIIAYPNPVSDYLNVSFNFMDKQDIIIELSDITGRKVFLEKYNNLIGKEEKSISFSNLKSGIYILNIYNTEKTFLKTVKIQKQ